MNDPPNNNDIKPSRVLFAGGNVRELTKAVRVYERRNTEAHAAIAKKFGKYDSQSAVLKVLGILVLAFLGTAVGLIIRAEGIMDDLRSEIADVRREEQGNAKEGFAIARSLRRQINECDVDVKELQSFHRARRPGKD